MNWAGDELISNRITVDNKNIMDTIANIHLEVKTIIEAKTTVPTVQCMRHLSSQAVNITITPPILDLSKKDIAIWFPGTLGKIHSISHDSTSTLVVLHGYTASNIIVKSHSAIINEFGASIEGGDYNCM